MEIKDVGSNSYKSRETARRNDDDTKRKPKMEKIASGIKVKPSTRSKIVDIFFPQGINTDEVWEYLLKERIAPGILAGIRGFCDDFLDATLGPASGRGAIYKAEKHRHTPYSSISSLYRSSDEPPKEREKGRWSRKPYAYSEVAFRSRAEAEEVLDAMEEALDRYKIVTVADLYELSGEEPEPTDFQYGWTSIKAARVEKISGGAFVISLPKASPID